MSFSHSATVKLGLIAINPNFNVLVGRVFANGPDDLGSITGLVIPKSLKIVLDTSFLNTQQYKVRIKGKVEESREMSYALCNSVE